MLFPGLRAQAAARRGRRLFPQHHLAAAQGFRAVAHGRRGRDRAPRALTVSYNEGARWMDSGEQVDGVALPAGSAAVDRRVRRARTTGPSRKRRSATRAARTRASASVATDVNERRMKRRGRQRERRGRFLSRWSRLKTGSRGEHAPPSAAGARQQGGRPEGARAGAAAARQAHVRFRLPRLLPSQGRRGHAPRRAEEALQRPAFQRDGRARRLHRRLQQDRADSARRCWRA